MERRFTPAARKPARSPSSSGPGLASSVTSASAARPRRSLTRPRSRPTCRGRQQRGRAAAEVDAHAAGAPCPPNCRSSRSTRRSSSRTAAVEQLRDAVAGPAGRRAGHDHEVAVRADARRRRGRGRRAPRRSGLPGAASGQAAIGATPAQAGRTGPPRPRQPPSSAPRRSPRGRDDPGAACPPVPPAGGRAWAGPRHARGIPWS